MRTIAFSRIIRWRFGTEPNRVVMLAAIHEADGSVTGEVWGAAQGGERVLLQRAANVTVPRTRRALQLEDGTTWDGPPPGCSCKTPAALRGFNPATVPA